MRQRRWAGGRDSDILSRLPKAIGPVLAWCKWGARKPSALVVDDDPNIPPLVELALARFGISSESVHDGSAAMDRLRSHSYDLIVLDLAMADLTGFDVLLALKQKRKRLRRIPVIVLTTDDSDEALARSFGYGADDFILKPFSVAEVGMRAYRLLYPLTSR